MKKLLIITIFLFFLSAGTAHAATRTWVGGTSTAWNTAANWAENAVPTSADDVVMNASPTSLTINLITTGGSVKSINFTGAGANLMTFSGNVGLTVAGSLTAQTGMTWSHSGTITMNNVGTLTSNSVAFGAAIDVNGASANVTLGDNFTNSAAGKNFTVSRGTFNTSASNFSVDTTTFGDYYNAAGTTIVGTSTQDLYVGSLTATSTTATSTFAGDVTIGSGTANSFGLDANGHLFSSSTAGTLSSGTGIYTDNGGWVTGCASACTITFNKAFSSIPACQIFEDSAGLVNAISITRSTTALVVTQTGLGTFSFHCGIGL